mmetsp:Transcript_56223/g.161362  ORF Transcript_56223/g.161362 Transcript_56223/m.161362 type:complete len:323 (+) Transcript_56223:3-971(+)
MHALFFAWAVMLRTQFHCWASLCPRSLCGDGIRQTFRSKGHGHVRKVGKRRCIVPESRTGVVLDVLRIRGVPLALLQVGPRPRASSTPPQDDGLQRQPHLRRRSLRRLHLRGEGGRPRGRHLHIRLRAGPDYHHRLVHERRWGRRRQGVAEWLGEAGARPRCQGRRECHVPQLRGHVLHRGSPCQALRKVLHLGDKWVPSQNAASAQNLTPWMLGPDLPTLLGRVGPQRRLRQEVLKDDYCRCRAAEQKLCPSGRFRSARGGGRRTGTGLLQSLPKFLLLAKIHRSDGASEGTRRARFSGPRLNVQFAVPELAEVANQGAVC